MRTLLFIVCAVVVAAGIGIYQRGRISDLEGKITKLEKEQRRLVRLEPEAGEGKGSVAGSAKQAGGDSKMPVAADGEVAVSQLLDEMGELIRLSEQSGDRQSMEKEGKALMIKLMTLPGESALKAIEEVERRNWPDEMKMGISMMLMTSVMETDPERAMNLVAKMELPGREGQMMLVMLAQQWAMKDPEKAAAYFSNPPAGSSVARLDGNLKQSIEGSIALGYSKRDLSKAFDYVAAIEDERTRKQVVQALSTEMKSEAQWRHFLATASGIEDAKLRSSAVLGLASTLSRQPFNREVMDSLDLPDSTKAEFARKFATSYIDSQTAGRANWAMEQSENEIDQRNLISQLVNRWTWQDFNGAAAWLRSLPDSRVRDDGVRIFSQLVAKKEPESAIDWARTIKDPKLREETLVDVYERAEKESPGTASAYLEELNLELEVKEASVVTPVPIDP